MRKIIRISTVPYSLKILLKGQHRFMSEHYEVVGVSSSGTMLEEVREDEGIRVETVEMTRVISPIQDLKSLWQFYRLCKKEKPFIVHSISPKAGILGMLAARLAGVPHRLHTVAGLPLMEAKGTKRKVLDIVEKLTYACATKVYPNSKGLCDFILDNKYTDAGKLKVIATGSSNGIDTSFFNAEAISVSDRMKLKASLNIKEDDFVFIFVGRFVGDKGINELVDAFKKLSKDNPKAKMLLVGSRSLESNLDPLSPQTIKEIESNPNIISVGFQKDVRPYFGISDALVFPSYREGFPNVVMQAGAMGLPSIVTNINGCNEIIIEDKNGTIVSPKDSNALYEKMHLLINHENYRKSLSSKAREMIASRYEQKVVWAALLEEYKFLEKIV